MVFYFLPQDFETVDQLNAFGIQKNVSQITQGDIRSSFPLPGKYHFRFRNLIEGKIVWIDLNGDHCKAVAYQGKILMKVTRIDWETDQKDESDEGHLIARQEVLNTSEKINEKVISFDLFSNE
jgi:hypothetical protein